MITDRDIATAVTHTIDGNIADYDIDGITREIINTYGLVDVDTIDSQTYWDLVARHDITAGMRILHSTIRDALYRGNDPDLQQFQNAIEDGSVLRESATGDGEYQIRVVEYTTPDTDETRWAYTSDDPAEAETIDFPSRKHAEVFYERDVRNMITVSGWKFATCDVTV